MAAQERTGCLTAVTFSTSVTPACSRSDMRMASFRIVFASSSTNRTFILPSTWSSMDVRSARLNAPLTPSLTFLTSTLPAGAVVGGGPAAADIKMQRNQKWPMISGSNSSGLFSPTFLTFGGCADFKKRRNHRSFFHPSGQIQRGEPAVSDIQWSVHPREPFRRASTRA